jgi:hypothetical protein
MPLQLDIHILLAKGIRQLFKDLAGSRFTPFYQRGCQWTFIPAR